MKTVCVTIALLIAGSGVGHASNAECWGNGKDDKSRPDITCTALTERLLLNLENASRGEVLKAMDQPGKQLGDVLQFLSNYSQGADPGHGAGLVDVGFGPDGLVSYIVAYVDAPDGGPDIQFIWNSAEPYACSDFWDSQNRCSP